MLPDLLLEVNQIPTNSFVFKLPFKVIITWADLKHDVIGTRIITYVYCR